MDEGEDKIVARIMFTFGKQLTALEKATGTKKSLIGGQA